MNQRSNQLHFNELTHNCMGRKDPCFSISAYILIRHSNCRSLLDKVLSSTVWDQENRIIRGLWVTLDSSELSRPWSRQVAALNKGFGVMSVSGRILHQSKSKVSLPGGPLPALGPSSEIFIVIDVSKQPFSRTICIWVRLHRGSLN